MSSSSSYCRSHLVVHSRSCKGQQEIHRIDKCCAQFACHGVDMFPGIHMAMDVFTNIYLDIVAFLGYDLVKQFGVAERIMPSLGELRM